MAFVMPAGDYERALRLSKGSSFIEALEAGVDRNIRRESNRQQMRQREELYNLQLEDEEAKRIEAEEQIVGEGLRLRDAVSGVDSEPTEEILGNLYAQGAGSPSLAGGGGTPIAAAGGSSRGAARGTTQGTAAPASGAPSQARPPLVKKGTPITQGKTPEAWEGMIGYRGEGGAEATAKAESDAMDSAIRTDIAGRPPERGTRYGQRSRERTSGDYYRRRQELVAEKYEGIVNRAYTAKGDLERAKAGLLRPFQNSEVRELAAIYEEAHEAASAIDPNYESANSIYKIKARQRHAQQQAEGGMGSDVISYGADPEGRRLGRRGQLDPAKEWVDWKPPAPAPAPTQTPLERALSVNAPVPSEEAPPPDLEAGSRGLGQPRSDAVGGAVSPTGSLISAAVPTMLDRALMTDASAAAAEGAISATKPIPEAADLAPGTTYPEPTEAPMSRLEQATVELGQEAELAATAGEERVLKEVEEVVIGEKVHNVKSGEHVYGISKEHATNPQAVINRNAPLFVDKKTGKPRKMTTPGGTVLEGPNLIYPGEKIFIPTGQGAQTGGLAGPIDDREGVSKGVLATVQDKAKSASEVESELNKLQEANPDKLVNPFQKFGRSILYTPARSSVAVAIKRAQRGNFSLINQMAGRPVRNRELVGLFADYDEFVRGAKTNAKEITLNRALAEKQKATLEDRRGHAALSNLFQDQIIRNGLSQEEAVLLGDYAADLHKVDPNLVSPFLKGYQALGSDERKTARMRLKNSRYATLARGSKGSVFNMKPSQIATNLRSWTNTRNSAEKAFTASVSAMREDPRFKSVMDIKEGFPVFTGKEDSPMAGLFRVELSNAIRLQEALDDAERHVQQWKYLQSQAIPSLPDTAEAPKAAPTEAAGEISYVEQVNPNDGKLYRQAHRGGKPIAKPELVEG
jgi:hypothetical protein